MPDNPIQYLGIVAILVGGVFICAATDIATFEKIRIRNKAKAFKAGMILLVLGVLLIGAPMLDVSLPDRSYDYAQAEGEWRIVERAESDNLEWKHMTWAFTFNVEGKHLRGDGRKIRVNGNEPTSGEKQARLTLNLTFSGLKAEGNAIEINHRNERFESVFELLFSDDFSSFEGVLKRKTGTVVATVAGARQ